MANKKTTTRRRGQKKQTEIEGTERFHDDEISAACEDLKDLRTKRTEIKAAHDAAVERLIEMLTERGLEEYVDPELQVKVTVSEKTRLSLREFKIRESTVDDGDE